MIVFFCAMFAVFLCGVYHTESDIYEGSATKEETSQLLITEEQLQYNNGQKVVPDKKRISPYDDIFYQQAKLLGWDWRMLAAMAWNESHFNPRATSSQGAVGIMQLMPRTAVRFGLVNDSLMHDPKANIEAGVKFLKRLDSMFAAVENPVERVYFILAGYNAGPGHVFDAMRLAKKYEANPYKWYDNVDGYVLKLKDKEYYTDSVCQHGFFRGKHTVRYVDDVNRTFHKYADIQ